MISLRKFYIVVSMVFVLTPLFSHAAENKYPDRTIELVVPYTPGGTTDIMARLLGKAVSDALGQSVVVINKPGAGAMVGVDYVAKSKPDGYTLLLASSTPIVISPLTNKAPYDPVKDLQPVAAISKQSLAIFVKKDFPANNIAELIDYSKTHGTSTFYGTYGLGSLAQLVGLMFNERTGTTLEHIAYKGSAPAMIDVIGGNTQVGIDMITPTIPQFEGGKIKVLAITGPNTYPQLPGVPSIESTVPNFDMSSWFGIIAPRGTPVDIVKTLNSTINKIVNSPEFAPHLAKLAMEPYTMSPDDYQKVIQTDLAQWRPLVLKAGLAPK